MKTFYIISILLSRTRHEHERTFHHLRIKRHRGGDGTNGGCAGLAGRAVCAIRGYKLDALVGELGDKAVALPGDVTNLDNLKNFVSDIRRQDGRA